MILFFIHGFWMWLMGREPEYLPELLADYVFRKAVDWHALI